MPRQELEYPTLPPAQANRHSQRVTHALRTIHTIINTCPLLNVSYNTPGAPFPTIIPMVGRLASFARPSADESDVLDLYLHVHAQHKIAKAARAPEGYPVAVAATHLEGLVLSMTPFSHSVNHRSAVVFGDAHLVEDDEERLWAIKLIVDGVVPQRWDHTRTPPTKAELTSTAVVRVKIVSGSAKIREGGPGEERVDLQTEGLGDAIWTGVIPVHMSMGEPVKAARCGVASVPGYIEDWRKEANQERESAALSAAQEAKKDD